MGVGATVRKVLGILSPESRRMLGWLAVVAFAATLFEAVGVAAIFPFASAASDPGWVQATPWARWLYQAGGFPDESLFMGVLGVGAVLVFLAGSAVSAGAAWLFCRFAHGETHRLSLRLLARYLSRPYTWFLRTHSAEVVRDVLEEVEHAVANVVVGGAMALARACLALLLFAGLLVLDVRATLTSLVVLAGIYFLVFRFHHRGAVSEGRRRMDAGRQRLKAVTESLAAIKEARLVTRRRHLVDLYAGPSRELSSLLASHDFLLSLSRVLVETTALGCVVLLALFLTGSGRSTMEALPMVGVYILATLRLVPAIDIIYRNVTRLRFYRPSLDRVHEELARPEAPPDPEEPLPLRRSILVRGVSFRYEGSPAQALRDVTLELPRGRATALVGTTGSGKTTLADLLAGLLEPEEGTVEVDGVPLQGPRVAAWQLNVGYVPQEIYLTEDTIRRNIALGLPDEAIEQEALERAARAAGIHEFVMGLEKGYDHVLGERGVSLSGGQRQRVGIARALYHDPEVLIFDEATSSLDNLTERRVMEQVYRLAGERTLIVIAHRLSTVQACDRLVLLEEGEVVAQGTYAELLALSPDFRAQAGAAGLAALHRAP